MKRIILASYIFAFVGLFQLQAQNEIEALRYSQQFTGSTARSAAMGGAFGALGGDFSSLSINPAGMAVYRNGDMMITPSLLLSKNNSVFEGTKSSDSDIGFKFNNIGMVFAIDEGESDMGDFTGISFGIGYTNFSNYNDNAMAFKEGISTSMANYFSSLAQGYEPANIPSDAAYFAWENYLINDDIDNNYTPNFSTYGQDFVRTSDKSGHSGEYVISLAGNFNHKLYIGGTIGLPRLKYNEKMIYEEYNFTTDAATDSVSAFRFGQNIETSGKGYNFKFGMIYRPVQWLRIGGAIHTPSKLIINDYYSEDLSVDFESGESKNVDVKDVEVDYELITPMRAIGSMAFVIGKSGLFSIDYEFIDYRSANLRSTGNFADSYNYRTENNAVENAYQAASNVKAGFEYAYGPFRMRGGAGYYQSPYKSEQINNNEYTLSYSAGLGLKQEESYIDIAWIMFNTKHKHFAYDPAISPISPISEDRYISKIMLTFGMRF